MKLKTLKDLDAYYEDIISDRCVSRKELKQEAIKIRRENIKTGLLISEHTWDWFFNIEEGDLEEKSK